MRYAKAINFIKIITFHVQNNRYTNKRRGKGFEHQFIGMTRIDDIEMYSSDEHDIQELTKRRIIKIINTGSYREKSSGIL